MNNNRYGEFRFCDYGVSWSIIVVMLLFSIASLILKLPIFCFFLFLVCAIIRLWAIINPHREQFVLYDRSIAVVKGKKRWTIPLPAKATLVVSYVDICPLLAMRGPIGNKTHILKNKYAISILEEMPLTAVLEILHQNRIQKYTTSNIKWMFDEHRYIYSFVCNQTLLDRLIINRKCQLIIPESLREVVSVDECLVDVYTDKGY